MSLSLKARANKQGHGRFIWLFANIRTHQVLYSLDKYPDENKMLKQLTYYGKQTQASHIRKDLWQPFAAVTFPNPDFGFTAFQRLREYRKLRDYTWTFKPTAKEIEEAKEAYEDGETDEIPRFDNRLPDKKERAKLLMDQKASSIADLADVLRREEIRFKQRAVEDARKSKRRQERSEHEWKQVTDLAAKSRGGELAKYEGYIKRMEEKVEGTQSERNKARGKKGLMMLKIKKNELMRAQEALDFIEDTAQVTLIQRLKWNQTLRALVQERTTKVVDFENPPKESKPDTSAEFYPMKQKSTLSVVHPKNAMIDPSLQLDPLEARDLPLDSVLIQWKDLHDAEYAQEWPGIVFHEQIKKEMLYQVKENGKLRPLGDEDIPIEENVGPQEEQKCVEQEDKNGFPGKVKETATAM